MPEPYLFEKSRPGRRAVVFPSAEEAAEPAIPAEYLRKEPAALPEMSELEVVRHFTRLSQLNFSIDTNFYPLGSCTMKYNPKAHEEYASLPGFARVHPYAPAEASQGVLELQYLASQWLEEICGMDRFSLQPAAGAHGEALGMLIAKAYHADQGKPRRRVLIPDSAHGTNPASAALAGYQVEQIPSNERGETDIEALRSQLGDDVAALMLTNPNTLGVFETKVEEIARLVHDAGGLLYYDGANLNAVAGAARPGDMGFDIVHLNLHKTFSTPHGGGGPGSGPVGVKEPLAPYLPRPLVVQTERGYGWDEEMPKSVGKMRAFYGNVGIVVRAYAYMRTLGAEGLRAVSRAAVLNANYIKERLKEEFPPAVDRVCMHECVLTAQKLAEETGARASDVAKALLDYGFHAPTIYFPLPSVTPEAVMIEPTETESKQTLDAFIAAMKAVAEEARRDPDALRSRPRNAPVERLDEVSAARKPKLAWTP